jgi:hypothetical protein
MSITFTANLDFNNLPTKMVRLVDIYEGLGNDDFATDNYAMDAEGFYITSEVDTDFTFERNFSNANFYAVIRAIDNNLAVLTSDEGGCYGVGEDGVNSLLGKVLKARNASKLSNHVRNATQDGNVIYCGMDIEYLERALDNIMEICQTAVKHKVGVSWA